MTQIGKIAKQTANVQEIREILSTAKNIAVVGLSDKPDRASYQVARYMQQQGYRIIPVNPTAASILGEPCYDRLEDVPVPIDLVNVFRRADAVPDIIDSAITLRIPAVWLQEGVVHEEAARRARDVGLVVVMDLCLLKEHMRYG